MNVNSLFTTIKMYYEVISEEKSILMNLGYMKLKNVLRNKPKFKVLKDIIIGLFFGNCRKKE